MDFINEQISINSNVMVIKLRFLIKTLTSLICTQLEHHCAVPVSDVTDDDVTDDDVTASQGRAAM